MYTVNMKECSKCGVKKPLDKFRKRKASRDGYEPSCKECRRAHDNATYKNSPERRTSIMEGREIAYKRNREFIYKYLLENPCTDCGETNPVVLEFDHLRDKVRNVSRAMGLSLKSLKEEIAKCEVVCANCHRIRTSKQFNWWYAGLG